MQKESSGSNYERHIGIMGTVKLKRLNELEEELKKTQEEIDNINHEEENQDKFYNIEYNSKVKKLKDILWEIELIHLEALEYAVPKCFKIKETVNSIHAFRTNKIFSDHGCLKLMVTELLYIYDTKSNQSHAFFDANREITLGYSLDEALDHIFSHYEKITEAEYNKFKKMVDNSITEEWGNELNEALTKASTETNH